MHYLNYRAAGDDYRDRQEEMYGESRRYALERARRLAEMRREQILRIVGEHPDGISPREVWQIMWRTSRKNTPPDVRAWIAGLVRQGRLVRTGNGNLRLPSPMRLWGDLDGHDHQR